MIRREADGKTPNGVLEETAFIGAAVKLMPPSLDGGVAALVAGGVAMWGFKPLRGLVGLVAVPPQVVIDRTLA